MDEMSDTEILRLGRDLPNSVEMDEVSEENDEEFRTSEED